MKNDQEPKEMELVEGGLSPDEMNRIWGARCVCSSDSAKNFKLGPIVCQCSITNPDTAMANARIAAE